MAGRPGWLLITGAFCGVLLGASQLLAPRAPASPDAIASVDGITIPRSEYQTYLESLARDFQRAPTRSERQHVQQRLVDEELLLARGLALELPRRDPALRKALIQSVIDNHLSTVAIPEPDDKTLQTFYRNHRDYFQPPPGLALKRLIFRGNDAAERANKASAALAKGTDFDTVGKRWGNAAAPLPSGLQPLPHWNQWLQESQARQLSELPAGSITQPQPTPDGWVIYWVTGIKQNSPPEFESIKSTVLTEWRRRENERSLDHYLEQLRTAADIRLSPVVTTTGNDR